MVCKISEKFIENKEDLKKFDYYYCLQGNRNFRYRNIRLIKNESKINYVGSTHEYLNVPLSYKSKNIDMEQFLIEDKGDGNNKSDKYERDIRILSQDINNPNV